MKKLIRIVFLFCLISCLLLGGLYYYFINSHGKDERVIINVSEGETYSTIGEKLKANGLIKSVFSYKIYVKINKPESLEHGDYVLNKSNNVKELIETMQKGSVNLEETKLVTFIEGKNMR